MGERGIAAEHLAIMRIHDAAACRIAELEPDGIEAPEQAKISCLQRFGNWLARWHNRLKARSDHGA
jgi:hypothetical protein